MPRKRSILNTNSESSKKLKPEKENIQQTEEETSLNLEKKFNLKIISWNVNGARAALKNGIMDYLETEDADILCLQETKCNEKNFPQEFTKWDKFPFKFYHHSVQDGYAGVSLFSKQKPIGVKYGINIEKYDNEGRVITAFYEKFILVNVYVPNARQGLKRLNLRMDFNQDFLNYLKSLDKEKPLIVCGDLNVAHKEIDLANPKTNHKTAGFTPEERADLTELLDSGFIDSYRMLYPNKIKSYTYWGYRFNCREKDIGWRLDYFLLSDRLKTQLCDNQIRKQIRGSDHCPIVLFMAF